MDQPNPVEDKSKDQAYQATPVCGVATGNGTSDDVTLVPPSHIPGVLNASVGHS